MCLYPRVPMQFDMKESRVYANLNTKLWSLGLDKFSMDCNNQSFCIHDFGFM